MYIYEQEATERVKTDQFSSPHLCLTFATILAPTFPIQIDVLIHDGISQPFLDISADDRSRETKEHFATCFVLKKKLVMN